jgi:ABC-type transporter Mla subunit MlaD
MADRERVEKILEDLIAVLQPPGQELEKLIAHVEQVTTRLRDE